MSKVSEMLYKAEGVVLRNWKAVAGAAFLLGAFALVGTLEHMWGC